ncbi:MAG: hypothetical protein CK532_02545 [Flavobacteriales bacterium]|nr:MAG: hypothetical protein CK532_02545 [Flavobacteriales bacterium]
MILTARITKPPQNDSRIHGGDSDSFLACSIIFKYNKYPVEGRKFGTQGIYWEIDGLGFVITSNESETVFSNSELNTYTISNNFAMWHAAGIALFN